MILLDGLNFMGQIQTFKKGVFLGLKDLLSEVLVEPGQEELVLEELGHVIKALFLYISQ